jgi:putative addiction module component (TIGR02574 family)
MPPAARAFANACAKKTAAREPRFHQCNLMATRPFVVDELTTDERIELIGRLWDSLDASAAAPMTDRLRQELARREAEGDRDPDSGEAWETLRDRLAKRTG